MSNVGHQLVVGSIVIPWRIITRVEARGKEKIPRDGAVLVFNHPTYLDPVQVQAAYGGLLYFLGKKEAFDWPFVGWVLREVGHQIPLDRQAGGNTAALQEAVKHLQAGDKIALAPEGTTSKGGPLGRGRSGAVRMALAAGVPVVPVAVQYKGILKRPIVTFGQPLLLRAWRGQVEDPAAVRAATDHMMAALAKLLGESYDPATAPDYARRKGVAPPGLQKERTG